MLARLCQLWNQDEFRRSLVTALRGWNSALDAGWPEQLRAAGLLKQIFDRYDSSAVANPQSAERNGSATPADHRSTAVVHASAHTASPETPAQTLDRLLDFPSRRLAVYGSLAPGKKNHHVIAGINGSWRRAVLHGSLRNEGWGAGEGFPGFLWDGTNVAVAAQVFSSADLPHYWTMLDEFEGDEYRRILVPTKILPQQAKIGLAGDPVIAGGEVEICNVYALAKS